MKVRAKTTAGHTIKVSVLLTGNAGLNEGTLLLEVCSGYNSFWVAEQDLITDDEQPYPFSRLKSELTDMNRQALEV